MVTAHPAHVTALQQRIDMLEIDLQHKREIVSRLLDREAHLRVRLLALTGDAYLAEERVA
jgi:hypothetical protein